MLGFLFVIFGGYVIASYILLRNPSLIHEPKLSVLRPVHISHRGGAGERLENTIEAFRNAVRLGTDMLELDCHMTKDGEVVVLHEGNLARITGVDMHINDVNYADLPNYLSKIEVEFDPGHYCISDSPITPKIPLLEDLFTAFPQVPMNIDIKTNDDQLVQRVSDLICKFRREKFTVWGSFSAAVSEKCAQVNPNIPRFIPLAPVVWLFIYYAVGLLPFVSLPYDYFEFPLKLDFCYPEYASAPGIFGMLARLIMKTLDWLLKSPKLFQHLNARGVPVILWVCNSESDYSHAFELGAQGVMTDYPQRLQTFLRTRHRPRTRQRRSNLGKSITAAQQPSNAHHHVWPNGHLIAGAPLSFKQGVCSA